MAELRGAPGQGAGMVGRRKEGHDGPSAGGTRRQGGPGKRVR